MPFRQFFDRHKILQILMVNSNLKFDVPQLGIPFFEKTNDGQSFFIVNFVIAFGQRIIFKRIGAAADNRIDILKPNTPNTPNLKRLFPIPFPACYRISCYFFTKFVKSITSLDFFLMNLR